MSYSESLSELDRLQDELSSVEMILVKEKTRKRFQDQHWENVQKEKEEMEKEIQEIQRENQEVKDKIKVIGEATESKRKYAQ